MALRHLVSASDLTKVDYDEVIRRAVHFVEHGISPTLMPGKVLATLFFQPSTRTMFSAQSAFVRAGGGYITSINGAGLSMEKGESFEDTIREFSHFADAILLRHPDDDSAERAGANATVPLVNAGSGSREHAMATPMILGSLAAHLKRPLQGLRLGIYGTPEINRVTKAMVPIFGHFGMEIVVDDLGEFPLPDDVVARAKANGLKSLSYGKLDEFIGDVDVLFCTRGLQKGIIPEGKFPKEREALVLKKYRPINLDDMKKLRQDAFLYMITPCIFEVEPAVFPDPRCIHTKNPYYVETQLAVFTYLLGINVD